ncbi:hypothetical protein, partial [Nonomuraea rhodomycinica]
MAIWHARNRKAVVTGRSPADPRRRLVRSALIATMALIPGLVQMQFQPVSADPVPAHLDIPTSPTKGASTVLPQKSSRSAEGLPHLVDSKATETGEPVRSPGKWKRPAGSLPLETHHQVTGERADGGLSTPAKSTKSTRDADEPVKTSKAAAGKVMDVSTAASEPSVSALTALGTLSSGVWVFSSDRPWFSAVVSDPEGRAVGLAVEVEHDPSVPGQGSGLIWSDYSSTTYTSGTRLTSGLVSSGSLRDGWLIRWRVRGLTASNAVKGPWSEWQAGKVDTSKPAVTSLATLGTYSSGTWILSGTSPWFSAVVTDPEGRLVGLGVEVEHDPSAAGQGSGLIWSDASSVSSTSGSRVFSEEMPSDDLKDGWLIRWRVRGLTANNAVKGPWSEWQAGKVDTSKPAVSSPTALGTLSSGLWTFSSDRPWFSAVVSDPEGRGVGLAVEVEHDPSVPGQGSGLIWSDYSSTTYISGTRLTSGLVSSG